MSQVVIQRSYFNLYKNKPNGISIARGMPKYFKGPQFIHLCPTWAQIRGKLGHDEFTRQYHRDVLDKLNPWDVVEFMNGKVMLCWETPDKFCHRETVAKWIENETGIIVPEYSVDSKPEAIVQSQLKLDI